MAAKMQRGLGRGLGALLGEAAENSEAARDEVRSLKLTDIDPNRGQPRERFEETALRELAESIRAVGVLQPIIVRKTGERYEIIAGERRFRAARLAGLEEIPAIVRDWDEQKRLEAALIENLQRDDLNPMEEAAGVKRLMEAAGLTQERVAERLGKSRPAVANLLRLLTLPEEVQKMRWPPHRRSRPRAGHGRPIAAGAACQPHRAAELVRAPTGAHLRPAGQARPQAPPAPGPGADGAGGHGARPLWHPREDRRRQKPRQTGHLLLQRRRSAAHLGGAGSRPPLKTARFNKQNT